MKQGRSPQLNWWGVIIQKFPIGRKTGKLHPLPYKHSTDILIFGGGIAGLWLLQRLRRAGYRVLLLQAGPLGDGQTIASQGIIHGGMKYALGGGFGKRDDIAQATAGMPARWRACLEGRGEADLEQVKVLSDAYYMWSGSTIASRLKGFIGSKTLQGRVETVKGGYPTLFRGEGNSDGESNVSSADHKTARRPRGTLYRLPDFVLDVPSLLHGLSHPHRDVIFQIDGNSIVFERNEQGRLSAVRVRGGSGGCRSNRDGHGGQDGTGAHINARLFLFAAGAGNEGLIERAGMKSARTQRRPLKMVYLKQRGLPPAFVHCLGGGLSPVPALTVTSHNAADGATVWYLGGELAERGVTRSDAEQIKTARAILQGQFPWLDFSGRTTREGTQDPEQETKAAGQWGVLDIDRAEAEASDGFRPDDARLHGENGALAVWPTKLTLTPALADKVMDYLNEQGIAPSSLSDTDGSLTEAGFPSPKVARPPWDHHDDRNSAACMSGNTNDTERA